LPEISGVEVAVLVKEIASRLRGTYVNNVYSIGEAQVFRFRQPHDAGEDVWVVASPRYGAWVSEKVTERAETTPFTTQLRSALERGRVEGVTQLDMDRIYDFAFAAGEETVRLVLELMPPGNVVVTEREGKILIALREVRTPRRRLVRGGVYSAPAQKRASPGSVDGESIARMLLSAQATVGQVIGRNLALPRKYVREVLHRLSLTESTPASVVATRASEIAAVVRGLVEEAHENATPCLCSTPEGLELFAVRPEAFEVVEEGESLGVLCDKVLLPLVMADIVPGGGERREGGSRKRELQTTLERLREQESGLLSEAERLRGLARQAAGAATTEEAASLLKGLAEGQASHERGATSPAAVASSLFDRAKDLERRREEVHSAARSISRRVTRENEEAAAPATRALKREARQWYEKFRWFFTSEGKLAIGGRDAQSNSILIRRHLDSNDAVYHADLFGSPFFLLKGGADQTEEEVREVAQATVAFSSAWKTGLSAADAFWVSPDQVQTSAPSGEYLAKGSFMIRGKKNLISHLLVEVAVGVDESGRVFAGPEEAISRIAAAFVVLVPYREKASDTAKRVLRELETQGLRGGVTLDDLIRALPAGGGKIVRKSRKKTGVTGEPKDSNAGEGTVPKY
jgi:predicted ribosome quality control (RQC) complex YloA/Tae2 family protein